MRYLLAIPVCCIAFLSACSSSNEEPETSENLPTALISFNYSGCKNYLSANEYKQVRNKNQREYIEYKCLGGGVLQISHMNTLYCCEQEKLSVSVEKGKNDIFITESKGKISTNCVCLYDLSYSISGLGQGHKYLLTIKRGNEEKIKFTIKYSLSGKGKMFVE